MSDIEEIKGKVQEVQELVAEKFGRVLNIYPSYKIGINMYSPAAEQENKTPHLYITETNTDHVYKPPRRVIDFVLEKLAERGVYLPLDPRVQVMEEVIAAAKGIEPEGLDI